jgi:hypothetical protein
MAKAKWKTHGVSIISMESGLRVNLKDKLILNTKADHFWKVISIMDNLMANSFIICKEKT